MVYHDPAQAVGDILDQVLPGLEKIDQAPRSILDIPGYRDIIDPLERDHFELAARRADREKWYKAVDRHGNVYRLKNPWSCRRVSVDDTGALVAVVIKPQMLMSYVEARSLAATSSSNRDRHSSKASEHQMSVGITYG